MMCLLSQAGEEGENVMRRDRRGRTATLVAGNGYRRERQRMQVVREKEPWPPARETFTRALREEILARQDPEDEVIFREVLKNNGVRLVGALRRQEGAAMPTVYLEQFYDDYLMGESVEEIADVVLEEIRRPVQIPHIGEFIHDYERARQRLGIRLIDAAANRELLSDLPWRRVMDMAAVVFFLVGRMPQGQGIITVHERDLERWGVEEKTLWQDAVESAPALMPADLRHLGETAQTRGLEDMYILSNVQNYYGASVILYPDTLPEAAQRLGGSFYVLPCSVHEMILVREGFVDDLQELSESVRDANRTVVAPEEVLTDSVYYYDAGEDALRRLR